MADRTNRATFVMGSMGLRTVFYDFQAMFIG